AATRFFALPNARLAAFNGGEPSARSHVAAALALDAASSDPGKSAPYGRFHRMHGPGLELIVDVGAAARGPWAASACAQTGAIEVACDGRWRLIVGSAASAKAPPGESVRGPRGGSCLALGDSRPDPEEDVAVDRQESEDAVWLDLSHDGWRREFGLSCTRRLYLDHSAGELRGEDAINPSGRARRGAASFEVRFHLALGVAASIASDGKSALLRPAGGSGWRLRSDAELRLEPGAIFEEGAPRTVEVLVMAGTVSLIKGARIRWKLSRDEARE
ncbi:MAG TPA: heparinase II/III family protein, partial [Caulobacteraceae bacterium]|nr:heparinase II/III family protein [Caulobacteraceae bacterium]